MKKLLPLFLMIVLSVLLNGCGKTSSQPAEQAPEGKKLNVVTTIFPQYDFVREIAGDQVSLTMLLPPGSESHSYEPTPQDIMTIQNCDLFICVGGESESWVDRILDSRDTSDMTVLSLIELVSAVPEELTEGMEAVHEHDIHEGGKAPPAQEPADAVEYDEHVWTSPKNAMIIAAAISDTLCRLDSARTDVYQANTEAFLAELAALDDRFTEIVENAARRTLVFGDRFPFRYFADAYGLSYDAAFPGCSSETEPSAATVAFLIDKVKDEKIPVIFHIEFSNERMADAISAETGAEKRLLHSCHNVSTEDMRAGVGYLSLMKANAETLQEALN